MSDLDEFDLALARVAERKDVREFADDSGVDPEWLTSWASGLIAPLIRELVAREIEAEAASRRAAAIERARARGGAVDTHAEDVRFGVEIAARIARGGAR